MAEAGGEAAAPAAREDPDPTEAGNDARPGDAPSSAGPGHGWRRPSSAGRGCRVHLSVRRLRGPAGRAGDLRALSVPSVTTRVPAVSPRVPSLQAPRNPSSCHTRQPTRRGRGRARIPHTPPPRQPHGCCEFSPSLSIVQTSMETPPPHTDPPTAVGPNLLSDHWGTPEQWDPSPITECVSPTAPQDPIPPVTSSRPPLTIEGVPVRPHCPCPHRRLRDTPPTGASPTDHCVPSSPTSAASPACRGLPSLWPRWGPPPTHRDRLTAGLRSRQASPGPCAGPRPVRPCPPGTCSSSRPRSPLPEAPRPLRPPRRGRRWPRPDRT
ncbi:uncharacterized protein LOC132084739 [Ammospiza nelsoni]|uniref:uncharacterized protein LOC132084739 n=1 Tax=Ammospiza nelsoni TaxID=2857394 RepID=UPI00286D6078|nr:uncharacterized protein LOC132084739 [Ammospiza nelsoni]